jgi:hypothetical protein
MTVPLQVLPAGPASQAQDAQSAQADVTAFSGPAGKVIVFVVITIGLVAIAGASGKPEMNGVTAIVVGVLMLILTGLILNRYGAIGGWLTGASKVLSS